MLDRADFRAYSTALVSAALEMNGPATTESTVELAQAFYERLRGGEATMHDLRKLLERESIVRALAETGGNITRAAMLLGMKRPRLSQLFREHGLPV